MGKRASVAAAGALAVPAALWARSQLAARYDLAGKSAIVTGGSRGLGLVIARQLAGHGARLTILARDEGELARARDDLAARGAEALALPCDVGDRAAVRAAVDRSAAHHGGVDIVVNAAGIIQVGPLEHMTLDDFEAAMNVHFWGTLYMTLAALPYMQKRGGGRIVNIASIAGKVAVPHLAPYAASKFAQVGLSYALRAELTRHDILVTTVTPGLMRTGSHIQALFKGRRSAEFTWFALGNALPLSGIDAERAARQVIAAMRRGDADLTVSIQARALALSAGLAPGLTARAMAVVNRMLPGPSSADGDQARPGRDSQSPLAPSILTALSDKASARNNELDEASQALSS